MRPYVHEIVECHGRPWQVTCVCDLDGVPAGAFAVTVGLATLGLPELLLPARPNPPSRRGPRPGVGPQWRLSHRDLADLLGGLAEELVAGDLWSRTFESALDAGLIAARLLPSAPVPLDALDAAVPAVLPGLGSATAPATELVGRLVGTGRDQDPAGPDVVLVPWELVDGGAGLAVFLASVTGQERAPLAAQVAAVRARSDALRAEILERGTRPGHVPARWRPAPAPLPARPRTEGAARRFGPQHELVVARAEQVLLSDPVLLTAFLRLARELGDDSAGQALGPVEALSTATGRAHLPAELELAAHDVTTLLTGRGGHQVRWRLAWQALPVCRVHQEQIEGSALASLRLHVHALLAAEAFSDVLPHEAVLRGRLAWGAALEASVAHDRRARHG